MKVKNLNNGFSERDFNQLKTYKYKQNNSRDKYFISGLDEEFIQKYIKNHFQKKNLYRNKDLLSSKSTKLIETNQSTHKSSINQLSKRTSNNLNDSLNKINEKKNNSLNKFEINKLSNSIKYSSQNLLCKKRIDKLNNSISKINLSNVKYCKSVKNFNKSDITYNNSHREFNSIKTNNIRLIRQKSEKEIQIMKNHNRNKTQELKVFSNNKNKKNYEKYTQLLINKITILKYEISKYKEEKKQFEKELNSIKPSIKQQQYINILTIEIKNYKNLQEIYKKNCDE